MGRDTRSIETPSLRCSKVRHMKRKRRKRTSRASAQRPQPRGFDYGCLSHAMALGSIEFPNLLTAASVDAVAYGSVRSEAVNQTVPVISLVAKHGDELAKAFEEFNAWSQMTDPDSVEITFVFRKDGGYLFTISPDSSRLQRRCLGFDRAHQAMTVAPVWIKPIKSIDPLLKRFRQFSSAPIAPFLFDGVTYVGPQSMLTSSLRPDLCRVRGLQPLLKFEVTFIDEEEVTPNSTAWLALKAASQHLPKSPKRPPKPEPDDIAKQRVKTLAHHFPVTLERIRRSLFVRILILELAKKGVRPWQIEQALCNLVLSSEMGFGAHFSGLSASRSKSVIIQAISSRFELADGCDISTFDIEDVSAQVVADGNFLLRHFGKKRRTDLQGVQATLQSISAHEATTAVDPPSEWSVSL